MDELFIARFWQKVPNRPEEGCWEWTASKKQGYGQLSYRKKSKTPLYAHRISYEIANGPIPEDVVIRHRCDNPSCVNPDHLEPGTQGDNIRDMFRRKRVKSRGLKGHTHPGAKLNLEERQLVINSNEKLQVLADRYGVTKTCIHLIRKKGY